MKVSSITLFLALSSPLRTVKVKVPVPFCTLEISYLKLSADPDLSDPSLFSDPASLAPVELLKIDPLPTVSKVNGLFSEPVAAVISVLEPTE